MTIRDGCYAICPHCGDTRGDCWEWLTSEDPIETTCEACGEIFRAWAEFDVRYCTDKLPAPREGASK